jgi:FixJ family two-component response regulator
MVAGLQSRAIGEKLAVGEKTIKVYRGRVHEKMGVKTLAGLVRMTLGIPIEDPS